MRISPQFSGITFAPKNIDPQLIMTAATYEPYITDLEPIIDIKVPNNKTSVLCPPQGSDWLPRPVYRDKNDHDTFIKETIQTGSALKNLFQLLYPPVLGKDLDPGFIRLLGMESQRFDNLNPTIDQNVQIWIHQNQVDCTFQSGQKQTIHRRISWRHPKDPDKVFLDRALKTVEALNKLFTNNPNPPILDPSVSDSLIHTLGDYASLINAISQVKCKVSQAQIDWTFANGETRTVYRYFDKDADFIKRALVTGSALQKILAINTTHPPKIAPNVSDSLIQTLGNAHDTLKKLYPIQLEIQQNEIKLIFPAALNKPPQIVQRPKKWFTYQSDKAFLELTVRTAFSLQKLYKTHTVNLLTTSRLTP